MKQCSKCSIEKPLTDYYKHSGFKDGRNNRCIPCYKDTRKPRNKEREKRYNIERRYGLTEEGYAAMHEAQKGRCAVCKDPLTVYGKSTHVDHCHTTGAVRGLLCSKCNKGLGMFRDNQEFLASAIKYLQEKG